MRKDKAADQSIAFVDKAIDAAIPLVAYPLAGFVIVFGLLALWIPTLFEEGRKAPARGLYFI